MSLTEITPTDPLTLPNVFDYLEIIKDEVKQEEKKFFTSPTKTQKSSYPILPTLILYLVLLGLIPIGCLFIKNTIPNLTFLKPTPSFINSNQPIASNKQTLATLTNTQNGYTFKYPNSFTITNEQDGINLTPSSGKGKIIILIKNQTPNIEITNNSLTQPEKAYLSETAKIIKDSFTLIQPLNYTDQQLKNRFENTKNLQVN